MPVTLTVTNLRSITKAHIVIDPLALVIGPNEAGKTTLATAAAALLTGQTGLWPETLKGEAKILVNRFSGAKHAKAALTVDGGEARVSWPPGEMETDGAFLQSSVWGAGLRSLCDLKPKERVAALYALLKPEPTVDDWKAAFRDVTLPEGAADDVWEKVAKQGWDEALAGAQKRRGDQVRAWETAAGEAYGSEKVRDWKPDGLTPDLETTDETALQQEVTVAKAKLEEGLRGAGATDAERSRLQALADTVKERHQDLDRAETVFATSAGGVNAAEKARLALPKVADGTVKRWTVACPDCGVVHEVKITPGDRGVGIASVALEPASDEEAGAAAADDLNKKTRIAIANADGALSNAKGAHAQAQAAVYKAGAALTEAETAAKTLAALKEAPKGQTDLAWLRQDVQRAEARLALFTRWQAATDAAEFIGYADRFVAALRPEGVRGKKLAQSLTMFNEKVGSITDRAQWPEILVKPDDKDGLAIFYKAEPYGRGSASAQWRCRVALQVAMAELSKDQMIVIDAADINDRERRGDLLEMLAQMSIPTLVCMTAFEDQVPDLSALDPPLGRTYIIQKDGAVIDMADLPVENEAEEMEPVS